VTKLRDVFVVRIGMHTPTPLYSRNMGVSGNKSPKFGSCKIFHVKFYPVSLNTGSFFCENKIGLVVSNLKKPLNKIVRKQQNSCEIELDYVHLFANY